MESDKTRMFAQLEEALGHIFSNEDLLVEALTHRSFVNEARGATIADNQRFEFLGDAVLGLIVGGRLLTLFPGSCEGDLSRSRASLVDESTLAGLAEKLDLGSFLLLGRGEEKTGGRKKRSILADAFEAVTAAVYLDGGLAAAEGFIDRIFGPLLASGGVTVGERDSKTRFQEISQARYGMVPIYLLESVSGPDHEHLFTVAVRVGDKVFGRGIGKSKKEAEQEAASAALARFDHAEG
jgi:ribonuclease III